MGFHDVLLLLAVILAVLVIGGGLVLWFVLRNLHFSELRRDVDYVKSLMADHISKQEELEQMHRESLKSIEDGIKGVYEARDRDKVYQQQISDQVRQKLGIERRTAMRQRRELERNQVPNPPSLEPEK